MLFSADCLNPGRLATSFKKLNVNSATLNVGEYVGRKTNQDP